MFWRMLWFALVITVSPAVVAAQAVCDSALLDEALAQLGNTCADMDRNMACYGNNAVAVTLVPSAAPVTFSQPTDQLELAILDTLTTATYDPASEEWGIAVLNVQANLPGTLPGQGVVMLAIGGAELTNDSPDAQPMQAFTFRSGVGQGSCEAAPSLLAIRSPENVTVQLTMNGLDFTLGSTLFVVDNQDGTYTAVLTDGQMTLADGTTLNAGEALDLTVDPATNAVTGQGTPRAATPGELALTAAITPLLETVAPPQVLYTVQPGDNLFRIALDNGTCVSALARANGIPEDQVRTVVAGRVLVLPDDSGCGPLVNDVPGGDVPVLVVTATPNPVAPVAPEAPGEVVPVDCSGFGLVAPLSGLAWGAQTFYWNGVDAAGYYAVTLTHSGEGVLSTAVQAPATSTTVDLSDLPRSVETYTWAVTAHAADGTVLCSATSPALLREFGEPGNDNDQDDGYGAFVPQDTITARHLVADAQRRELLLGASLMLMVGSVVAFGALGARRED